MRVPLTRTQRERLRALLEPIKDRICWRAVVAGAEPSHFCAAAPCRRVGQDVLVRRHGIRVYRRGKCLLVKRRDIDEAVRLPGGSRPAALLRDTRGRTRSVGKSRLS